ncbi:MAG: EVE domain-containing protein [Planctomycetota bacterium]|nr:EVE domain-containing protein [Planctomycetota bacterium]
MPQHWLFKSEPGVYSIDDLKRDKKSSWDGVRNYQARNYLRDSMKRGDLVLFYHSGSEIPEAGPGIAGVAKITREGYPDATALDPKHPHHDPKSTQAEPIWMMVDIEFVERFPAVVSLEELKGEKALEGMLVLRKGQRLSVMPVEPVHFEHVLKLGRSRK